MHTEIGVMDGGTPNGDRNSLERLAQEVNEREKQRWLAKKKQMEAEKKSRENQSAGSY